MFFNAEELDNKKARKICKTLFICGFFFMPVLWIMLIWFCFKYISPAVPYRNQYIVICCLLLLIELVVLMSWNLVFQFNWFNWGAVGDYLSINKYKGQLN